MTRKTITLAVSLAMAASGVASGLPLVAIDPGHGGRDTGAVGVLPPGTQTGLPPRTDPTGQTVIYEKDVTLDVALRVNQSLIARGFPTLLTRTIDAGAGDVTFPGTKVDLMRRTDMANAAGAGLFVSIHENALSAMATGTESYQFYVGDPASLALALAVHQEVVIGVGLPDRGIKRAGFYVLKHTTMPAVLVEGAFLSNPTEALFLARPEMRQRFADSVALGVDRYAHGNTQPSGAYTSLGPLPTTGAPAAPPVVRYWVTAGTFRTRREANLRRRALVRRHRVAVVRGRFIPHAHRRLYVVVTGRFTGLVGARAERARVRGLGFPGRIIGAPTVTGPVPPSPPPR